MANYNKVILVGNLTRDPQLRYTPNQQPVCDFGVAINRRWSGQDGQKREETTFVDCTAWARSAETINKYVGKGDPILVEGRLQTRTWDGPDGKKRSKLSVVVERFQFLGRASGARRPAAATAEPEGPPPTDEAPGEFNQDFPPSEAEDETIPF